MCGHGKEGNLEHMPGLASAGTTLISCAAGLLIEPNVSRGPKNHGVSLHVSDIFGDH